MHKRFFEIKQLAKQSMRGRFGKALVITIIPALLFGLISSIFMFIFSPLLGDLSFYIETMISAYATFITLCLVIPFYKGKNNISGDDFFVFDRRLLHYFLFTLVISIISSSVPLPFNEQLESLANATPTMLQSSQYYNNLIATITTTQILLSIFIFLITIYITVRLLFVPYIIVDQNMSFIDGIRKSWTYTSGKFWYLFFFPLSFILWFLLVIPTLFLILLYLIPYMTISFTALYIEFKKANGDEKEEIKSTPVDEEYVDILDDDLYR